MKYANLNCVDNKVEHCCVISVVYHDKGLSEGAKLRSQLFECGLSEETNIVIHFSEV